MCGCLHNSVPFSGIKTSTSRLPVLAPLALASPSLPGGTPAPRLEGCNQVWLLQVEDKVIHTTGQTSH